MHANSSRQRERKLMTTFMQRKWIKHGKYSHKIERLLISEIISQRIATKDFTRQVVGTGTACGYVSCLFFHVKIFRVSTQQSRVYWRYTIMSKNEDGELHFVPPVSVCKSRWHLCKSRWQRLQPKERFYKRKKKSLIVKYPIATTVSNGWYRLQNHATQYVQAKT